MTHPPPLETLLRQILDQELSARGLEPEPAAREAARQELARSLHPGVSSGIPCQELENALARALRLAVSAADPAKPAPASERAPASNQAPAGAGRKLVIGEVLDSKYEIEALLAEGGFGQVYRARDQALDCAVAIKVLKADEEGARERLLELQQEARRLTRLRHPNIVEWKTLNRTADGRHYLVMEFLDGELLEEVLRREGKLPPARAARILLELCDALGHAHALPDGACLLHLDLKPTNVFLVHACSVMSANQPGAERVKVLDFGISRFASASRVEEAPASPTTFVPGATASFVTATGSVACTPQYCSPEQAARALGGTGAPALDARSDLYSLGVLGYRMLTGRFPHESAPDLVTTLRWRQQRAAAPVSASGVPVPRRLARFVERCLALDPAARFADARSAHIELQEILAPRSPVLFLAGAAGAVLLGVLAYALASMPELLPPLHAVVSASGRNAAQDPLWFGPARPSLVLELPDLLAGAQAREVRLVDGAGSGAAAVPGWRLEARDDRHVELVADGAGPTRRATALLALDSERGRQASDPLELVFVAPSAWELVSADVDVRGARALDPHGQTLEVVVRGLCAALPAALQLQLGERAWSVVRDEFRSSEEHATYRIDLSDIAWNEVDWNDIDWSAAAGAPPLVLRLEDHAGNVLLHTLDFPLVLEPLVVESLQLEGVAQAAGRWHVLSGEPVRLLAEGNRISRLRWTLEDSEGRAMDGGTADEGATTHRLSIDSARWPGRSFDGVLRVSLAEDEWVAHADGTGAAHGELALEVRTTGAVFDVSLSGARSWIEENRLEPVYYVAGGPLRAAVHRDHDVPMLVTLTSARGDGLPGDAREVAFTGPMEERKSVELALEEDGLHRVILEGRRLGAEGRPLADVDLFRELELVRDTRAPQATLEGWSRDLVLRSAGELATVPFLVRAADEVFAAEPPPIAVAWSLALRQDGRAFELRSGALSLAPGASGALPAELLGALGDGRYALALEASDFAGNQDERREYEWSVSTEGPRLEVFVPAAGEPWTRASEVFTVELRAEDPNGVARVECVLSDELGVLAPRTVALEPLPASSGPTTRWVGRFELDQRWSGRSVRLSFGGRDVHGTESLRLVEVACTVGPIPSLVPAHVEVGRPGSAGARMCRVPGNHQVLYLFGGRGDFLENSLFRAHGLADFSDRTITSSLRLECPPGSIADFYLDEHEVSVAQVLEFLRAPGGCADGLWWDTPEPREERRLELERVFAESDPALPATGLTCLEAQAFAAWAGKELPTYLHWEYAVRGLLARPYSFADEVESGAAGARVNVATGRAWPVASGDDRTPDTLLADLCSNVAEWTSTPVHGPLSALSVTGLLQPARALPGARHFVVGGAFDRPAFHFGAIARRACDETSAAIGFRCMLPAAEVEAAFLDQAGDLTVRPIR